MPPLMNLPAYEVRNALVDFSPITNAIDSNRQNALATRRMDMEGERLGMERERFGLEKQRFASQRQDEIRKRVGGLALLTLQEKDPAKRDAMWKRVYGMHPDAKSLPGHYADVNAGPLALLGDAGMADDYLKLQIQQQQASIAAQSAALAQEQGRRAAELHPGALDLQKAQIAQANRKDEVSELTAGLMREAFGIAPKPGGPTPNSAPPAAGSPQMRPMSNPVEESTDPYLIRTQTAAPGGQQPAAQSNEPTIMVLGKPTPLSKAATLGNVFLMNAQTKGLGEQIMKDVEKAQLSQPTINTLQTNLVSGAASIQRLEDIKSLYRPEFQTFEGQLAMTGIKFADMSKTLRGNLTPEHRKQLEDYSSYRLNAANAINQYIKEITGTQMSEAEAKRLVKALPNYETDSPTEFTAKLNESLRVARLAVVRNSYLLRNGLNNVNAMMGLKEGQDQITKTQWFLPNFERFMEQKKDEFIRIYGGDMGKVRAAMKQEFAI